MELPGVDGWRNRRYRRFEQFRSALGLADRVPSRRPSAAVDDAARPATTICRLHLKSG
jgi:hypothetical protein